MDNKDNIFDDIDPIDESPELAEDDLIEEVPDEYPGDAYKGSRFGEEEFNRSLEKDHYYEEEQKRLEEELAEAQWNKSRNYKFVDEDSEEAQLALHQNNSGNSNNSESNNNSNSDGNSNNSESNNNSNGDGNSNNSESNNNSDSNESINNDDNSSSNSNSSESTDSSEQNNSNNSGSNSSEGPTGNRYINEDEKKKKERENNNGENDNNNNRQVVRNEQGQVAVDKTNKDKREDRKKVRDAKAAVAKNKVDSAKSKVYQYTHPIDAAKAKLKAKIRRKIIASILAHPLVWLAFGGVVLLLFIIIIIALSMAIVADDEDVDGSRGLFGNGICTLFPLNSTTLTETEFTNLLVNYKSSYSGSNSAELQIFVDNAKTIYRMSTNNNINPELVVVRAVVEGFSPGSAKNNYWGLGCTNTGGYAACINYDSFDEGVLGFINNVSNYSSTEDMMSRYAYIGSYWYNPGSSSVGGCYYYPYISEYMDDTRSNQVNNYCSDSNTCDGSNCEPTTDADQDAYSRWQVANMATYRESIFGLTPPTCDASSGTFVGDEVIWKQSDPEVSRIHLGNSSATMGGAGCAVTSIGMGIHNSGATLNVSDFTLKFFINYLNSHGCFTAYGGIYWNCSAMRDILPTLSGRVVQTSGKSSSQILAYINSLPANSFTIMYFPYKWDGHYVVYHGNNSAAYEVLDPATGKLENYPHSYPVSHLVVYTY